MSDPTPDQPSQLRVGSLDYTPGALDTSRLRPEVAEHHQAVAAELTDHAARRVLDILAATMHHADFTYNVTAELVNNIVAFAAEPCRWERVLTRLDRVIEVLEEIRDARQAKDTPRGYTLGQMVQDLLERHDKGLLSDAVFYDRMAEMTGIRYPDKEQVRLRFAGRDLNAEEAREAESAGLVVVECTDASDPEPVFVVDNEGRRPEQGHIVNSPRFQAALEDFRQKYEQGRIDEL